MNDWVVIFETGQLYRAELVKSLLNDNNVEAVILNQKDSSFKIGAIEGMEYVRRGYEDIKGDLKSLGIVIY